MSTLEQRVDALAAQLGTDIATVNSLIAALDAADGDLSTLSTTAKNNLVAALNELKSDIDNVDVSSVIDDVNGGAAKTWSADKINSQITNAIDGLVGGAGDAYNTLKELATELQSNDSAIATLLAAQSNRLAVDQAQNFTESAKQQGRDNLGAASASDLTTLDAAVGDTGLNFVNTYNAAKSA